MKSNESIMDKISDIFFDSWIYLVVGCAGLIGYFGKRTLDRLDALQSDHLTHEDYASLSNKIDTLHRRIDDLYKLLVSIHNKPPGG